MVAIVFREFEHKPPLPGDPFLSLLLWNSRSLAVVANYFLLKFAQEGSTWIKHPVVFDEKAITLILIQKLFDWNSYFKVMIWEIFLLFSPNPQQEQKTKPKKEKK